MVYNFQRFWLGTRLIFDFESICKEKLVFAELMNVVLGSKVPKSMYCSFPNFLFYFIWDLLRNCYGYGLHILWLS